VRQVWYTIDTPFNGNLRGESRMLEHLKSGALGRHRLCECQSAKAALYIQVPILAITVAVHSMAKFVWRKGLHGGLVATGVGGDAWFMRLLTAFSQRQGLKSVKLDEHRLWKLSR
jgi:hypothetical protein